MKTCFYYKLDELEAMLGGYELQRVKIVKEDEDGDIKNGFEYHFVYFPIDHLHYYDSAFLSTSMTVYLANGAELVAYSDNIEPSEGYFLRINDTHLISPRLLCNDEYVEATEDLKNWLHKRGLTDDKLNAISTSFTMYTTITYEGIYSVFKSPRGWGYSSEYLTLDEREIEKVLNGIDDELLREKIKSILYANVFKRRY